GRGGVGVARDLLHVEGGAAHAVGLGQDLLQLLLADEAQLVEAGAQAAPVEDLVVDRLLELALGDDAPVLEQPREDGSALSPFRQDAYSNHPAAFATAPARGYDPIRPVSEHHFRT